MLELLVNGKRVRVEPGATVAAAVYAAGETTFRISVQGQSRAPLCGMGICMECRVTIDGVPQQRSCLVLARQGMVIETA